MTKTDKILLALLLLFYLVPLASVGSSTNNPFDLQAQLAFIIWFRKLDIPLSILAIITCILLIHFTKIKWIIIIGTLAILLPIISLLIICFPI